MIKYLKFELYKLFRSKFLLLTFVLIFLYSLLVNLLYSSDGLVLLYDAFVEEYLILYLCLSVFYSSFIINDEFSYETIYDIRNGKILITKMLLNILFILLVFIFSIVICYDISLIVFKLPSINLKIILNIIKLFIKILPMLLIINIITMIFSLLFLKSNTSLGLSFIIYFLMPYFNSIVIHKKIYSLYWLFSLHWDQRNLPLKDIISPNLSIIINGIWIILLLIFLTILFFKRKKN